MRSRMTKLIAGAVAAGLLLGIPVVALAQESEPTAPGEARIIDLDRIKERAQVAIDRRLERIDRLEGAVDNHPHLAEGHAGQLRGQLHAARAGLNHLGGEIERVGTVEELRDLIPKIAEDYRIYLLVGPKVRLVIGADTTDHAVVRFRAIETKLAEKIAKVAEEGGDVTEARELFDQMSAAVDQAAALAEPVPDELIPLEASDWPDPAKGFLTDARSDLIAAREFLRDARDRARLVIEALRNALADTNRGEAGT